MAATIVSGKTFTQGEQVTAAKLHQIIESAIITNIDQTNVASNAGICIASGTAPTDTDAIWYDTTLSLLRIHDGTNWVPVGRGVVLTNNSGVTVSTGDCVIIDITADNSFTRTTTQSDMRVIGVAAESIANGASGVILTHGPATVNLNSAGTKGMGFLTSTTAGKARPFGNVPETGMFGSIIRSGTNNVKCILWGHPCL